MRSMFPNSIRLESRECKMNFNIGIGFVVVFALALYGVGTYLIHLRNKKEQNGE